MTVLASDPTAEPAAGPDPAGPSRRAVPVLAVAEHLAVAVALLWWALPFTAAGGGRDTGAVTAALPALLPAFALARPWRRLGPGALGLAAGVTLAALAVCALAPTGWDGADVAAGYGYAAALLVTALAYGQPDAGVARVGRRLLLVAAVCLAGAQQFGQAWLPWWGGESVSRPMIGTFYWHDPFAAYLLGPALLGLGLAVWGGRPLRLLGWFAAPLAAAGVTFSSSRAAFAALLGGWLLLGGAALGGPRRRAAGVRWLALTGLAAAFTALLCGPPFFRHWGSPFASTVARSAAGETLGSNGGYRWQFWREAATVLGRHPATGTGFHGFGPAATGVGQADWAHSILAHNGYLQALVDGGALLGVPFLLAVAAVVVALARRGRQAWTATGDQRVLGLAGPLAAAALLAHSVLDVDWSYPAQLAMTALVTAVALARPAPAGTNADDDRPAAPGRARPAFAATALLAGGLLLTVAASARMATTSRTVDGVRGVDAATATRLLATTRGPLAGTRGAVRLLHLAVPMHPGVPLAAPAADVRDAVRAAARPARADVHLQLLRAQATTLLGDPARGLAMADEVLGRLGARRDAVALDAAAVLATAGEPGRAHALLLDTVRAAGAPHGPDPWPAVLALAGLDVAQPPATTDAALAADEEVRCAWAAAAAAHPAGRPTGVPTPPAPRAPASCVPAVGR